MNITQHIIDFFSNTHTNIPDKTGFDTIKEYSSITDDITSINWKKTAQTDKVMSNVYEKEITVGGTIILISSPNLYTGENKSIKKTIDIIFQELQQYIGFNDHITIITLQSPDELPVHPKNKCLIISDFLREKNQIKKFLKNYNANIVHGLCIPLLTPLGYTYPSWTKKRLMVLTP